MRRLRSVAALLGFGAFVALGSTASATERLAALVPQTRPSAPPELRDRFHEAVTRGLQTGGDEVLPAAEVRLRLGVADEMLNCGGTGPCVARSAQALRIDRLVATDVEISGKDYAIKMRLLDSVGRELTKIDEPCDICTVKEADEAMVRAATKLAAAARTLPAESASATQRAEPTPPQKPETPAKAETPPVSKVQTPPSTASPETMPPLTHREKKMFPWRPVAIASIAVGVVGIVASIPLFVIDGRPTCDKPNPTQSCPEVYNTVGGGAALLSLGVGGGIASGILFYLDHRARVRAHSTVLIVPSPGGAYVSASGRF
jgi:hypothetical protein